MCHSNEWNKSSRVTRRYLFIIALLRLLKQPGTAVWSEVQPNQEQALVCFPAQGGHAVCRHTMRMVLWGEAGVAIFLIVFCGWWWAGSLRLGCNHCDGCFRVAPVALFSDQSHLYTGRVDLLLLPQLFLSSVGNRVLRDSLPASPSRGE